MMSIRMCTEEHIAVTPRLQCARVSAILSGQRDAAVRLWQPADSPSGGMILQIPARNHIIRFTQSS